ncbi:hypothetical protein D9758_013151 [Tetrapyrgos nigripes]|uniref:Heterokaryon incompatibility domain-containing protein n=1 Tax=Tetrapyrgos nigripes TaxID=182062 RepID=A0A8H5FKN1_9AGAR|nr:hypothetical protein D9758_013151 [Tetrapyrgos nigripes]
MRLLNTKTLKLEEFFTDIPPYAILSHTWEKEEVTFKDIQNPITARLKAGYAKIKNACVRARRYDFRWIWIDTCCINKESSAELSEAINSMYQYYMDAAVCYVYLSDVSAELHPRNPNSRFSRSRWFSRGWTLQELLAPQYVVFVDKEWASIGTRWGLRDVISAITSIPMQVFEGRHIEEYSIAQRMSWAASRQTTRPEDEAYCLMGIFSVSMPPIYGEGGPKAFMRLQQEIIKISDDRSIFAWASPTHSDEARGLLARSPHEFLASGDVEASDSGTIGLKSSFSFGNNGLHIHLPLARVNSSSPLYLASLHCQSGRDGSYVGVYLIKEGQRYYRVDVHDVPLSPFPPLVDDMQEVIVTEALPPRPILPRSIHEYSAKLLPSARHFSCDTVPSPTFSISRFGMHESLVYKSRNTRDSFTIAYSSYPPDMYWKLGDETLRNDDQMKDMALQLLEDGGYISVTCEVTGNHSQRILEIDYISEKDPEAAFLEPKVPPHSGFIVERWLVGCQSTLAEIYPPDPFGKQLDYGLTYVTVSDTVKGESFRVLSYKSGNGGREIIYIALGFEGLEPWLDVVVCEDIQSSENIEDIWKSYSDIDGSRTQKRLSCKTSASDYFGRYQDLNVVLEKRRKLQLGSHVLSYKLVPLV